MQDRALLASLNQLGADMRYHSNKKKSGAKNLGGVDVPAASSLAWSLELAGVGKWCDPAYRESWGLPGQACVPRALESHPSSQLWVRCGQESGERFGALPNLQAPWELSLVLCAFISGFCASKLLSCLLPGMQPWL